jgi:NAD+ diphosphatase
LSALAYTRSSLDRCANRRSEAAWLAEQRNAADARMVHINGDSTVFSNGKLVTDIPGTGEAVFLGIDGHGAPWFACRSDQAHNLRDLRSLALEGLLPCHELGILAQARALIHWHERRGFCSNCGGRNEIADAGYRRHCRSCAADHFPRTDPVVIIVPRSGKSILLGRQTAWPPGMYSALAGFIEPGETIEDGARREVFEEAGIRVGEVAYVASQPWPFPASLMIGLIGEATTKEITVNDKELEDARWFSFEEARMMVDCNHPHGLSASNPMAIAHLLMSSAIQES